MIRHDRCILPRVFDRRLRTSRPVLCSSAAIPVRSTRARASVSPRIAVASEGFHVTAVARRVNHAFVHVPCESRRSCGLSRNGSPPERVRAKRGCVWSSARFRFFPTCGLLACRARWFPPVRSYWRSRVRARSSLARVARAATARAPRRRPRAPVKRLELRALRSSRCRKCRRLT